MISGRKASPEIQPVPPDAGDYLGDDALFDNDSIHNGYETSASIESRASDAGESFSLHVDANNSALVEWSALNRAPRTHITTVPSEADTSSPVNSPHSPRITASLEEEPREDVSPPSAASSRVANGTIDSADETEELGPMAPPPAEDTLNRTVQSPAFTEVDTSVGIRASSSDFSTSHAEEDPNNVLSKQKQVAFEGFGSEDPAGRLRKKRLHTYEDGIDIRRRTDEERDTKRLRRDVILKRPLPSEDTAHIRTQTKKESDQMRQEREEVGIEEAQKGTQAKIVGTQIKVDEGEQENVVKRQRRRAGILEKWKQRNSSQLTSEDMAQRRRGMLHKAELDFVDEL